MFEQTAEGQQIAAEMAAKRQRGPAEAAVYAERDRRVAESHRERAAKHGHPAGPAPEVLSAESYAMRSALEAAHEKDEAAGFKARTDQLGADVEPGDGESTDPRPISPDQYRRPPLTDGRAAYSHQAGRPLQPAAARARISGADGPMAEAAIRSGAGRAMQRPAPRGDA